MTQRFAFLALAAGLACAAVTSPAGAFCRAKACDQTPMYDDVWQDMPDASCARDRHDCQVEGVPLYWGQSCLSFSVQKDGSPRRRIDYATTHGIVKEAFGTWLAADCGGAKPSFAVSDFSPAACDVPEFNRTRPNANVILFRDDGWGTDHDKLGAIALTTLSYYPETAEIFDADIELNSAEVPFVTGNNSISGIDLQAVLTHEIGHFLGLSHSDKADATMFMSYGAGAQQRTISPDDMAGICAAFPPGRSVDAQHCAPQNGFASECQPDEDLADGGCAVAAPERRPGTPAALFGSLALFALLRRRRR